MGIAQKMGKGVIKGLHKLEGVPYINTFKCLYVAQKGVRTNKCFCPSNRFGLPKLGALTNCQTPDFP